MTVNAGFLWAAALSAALATSGCEAMRSVPRRGYVNPHDDVFGAASRMEYTQKRMALVDVMEKMKTDPTFSAQYAAARSRAAAAGRRLPIVAVRPIENNTGDGRSDAEVTGQTYRELLAALRKTGLFEVTDYARRSQMKKTVVEAVDDGESPGSIQGIGAYAASDFVMTGELRRERTGDRDATVYHHFLNLEMTDTSTGTVFWSDVATPVVKYHLR